MFKHSDPANCFSNLDYLHDINANSTESVLVKILWDIPIRDRYSVNLEGTSGLPKEIGQAIKELRVTAVTLGYT